MIDFTIVFFMIISWLFGALSGYRLAKETEWKQKADLYDKKQVE